MSNDPDEIRSNIEATRKELGNDVDALADKVTPSKIAHRQTERVKDALGSARERLMGSASDAHATAASASDAVSGAAAKAKAKAQGNPLAVGLIAFGVGWLAASLVPPTAKEKELASQVKDAAQPVVDELTDSAKEAAQNLREPAREAAEAVKDSAADAAGAVREEATTAADDLKDQASNAKDAVQDQATSDH